MEDVAADERKLVSAVGCLVGGGDIHCTPSTKLFWFKLTSDMRGWLINLVVCPLGVVMTSSVHRLDCRCCLFRGLWSSTVSVATVK